MSIEQLMRGLEAIETNVTGLAFKVNAQLPEIHGRILDLEQKGVRGHRGGSASQSIGRQVAASVDFQAFAAKWGRGKVNIPIKAAITGDSESHGAIVAPHRIPGVALQQRRLTIRDLLPRASTNSNMVEYPREVEFDNQAAPQDGEGELKAESDVTFQLEQAPVRTIAHFMVASKQIMADSGALAGFIDTKLRYGLFHQEELQLLSGDGEGQNLDGLIPNATAFNPPFTPPNVTRIDELGLAIAQLQANEFEATGIILNPIDWWRIVQTKDELGLYIFSNPTAAATPTLWGLPVILTTAMPEGEFLVGDFINAAMIFDREEAMVEISSEDRDNFVKNLVTILCEERLAFAIFRSEALIHGEFTVPTEGA